ncbi:uncharacterized protein LOC135493267 [Lineus longissimus]|uniref:uncharacterized protein LOC135493267 n=1 Tax=Lineus longissimus TaxID=88925 RepID=UPI002B4EF266
MDRLFCIAALFHMIMASSNNASFDKVNCTIHDVDAATSNKTINCNGTFRDIDDPANSNKTIYNGTISDVNDPATANKTIHDIVKENLCKSVCQEDACQPNYDWPFGTGCYCDWACNIAKDCCFEAAQCEANMTKAENDARTQFENLFSYMSCWEIKLDGKYEKYWMVTRCPIKANEKFAQYCREGLPGFLEMSYLPLTDGIVSFRNYFCALCHVGASKAALLSSWNATKKCFDNDSNADSCRLEFNKLVDFKGLGFLAFRKCHSDFEYAVSSCSSVAPVEDVPQNISDSCGRVFAPVQVVAPFFGPIYKDIHCALCNGIRFETKLKCAAIPYVGPSGDVPNRDLNPVFSFKLLLDFERIQKEICDEWEIFDEDESLCKPVVCSEGYFASNGFCRKIIFLTIFVIGRATVDEKALLAELDVGFQKQPLGVANFTSVANNDSKQIFAEIFLRASIEFESQEIDELVSKLDKIWIDNFQMSSQLAFDGCHETNSVRINSTFGFRSFLANTSDYLLVVTPENSGMNLTTYLCSNSSKLSCPKVLYPKENYQWADGAPLVRPGSALTLRSDEFEIVDDFVFICADALQEKWSLFQGFLNDDDIQGVVTLVGLSLSLAGLAYTVLTYLILSPLRTLPGKMLMNLCVALFTSQLIFLTALDKTDDRIICSVIAMAEHYAWLVTFCWMNAISWNAMKTFSAKGMKDKDQVRKSYIRYYLYSWGTPALVVATCAVIEFCACTEFEVGYGNRNVCWISNFNTLMYTFALPICLIICSNIIMFSYTVSNIFKVSEMTKVTHSDKESRLNFWLYVKLSSVMGLTWIFGFLAAATNVKALWYVFIVFNTTQGILIGAGFSLNRRVLKMYSTEYSKSGSSRSVVRGDTLSSSKDQRTG